MVKKMNYYEEYKSPIGKIILISDGDFLTGLYFENQKYFPNLKEYKKEQKDIFDLTKKYLDLYFQGKDPKIEIPIHIKTTEFQKEVYEELSKIPFGEIRTYKEIATEIAKKREVETMSTQAVGTAIGKNPVSILIPCHRVIGVKNRLVGYAGGLDKKRSLLEIEGHKKESFKD